MKNLEKKCNLINNFYQNEDVINNYNSNLKSKVINQLNKIFIFLNENSDCKLFKFNGNEKIDIDFLDTSFKILDIYENIVLGNKYEYYNRDKFWSNQYLLMAIMYKYNFKNIEEYVICTLDRIIKNMFQNKSIAMIYPEYFKDGKIKKEYENLSMEELEKKYRNEFGNRYDDKLID